MPQKPAGEEIMTSTTNPDQLINVKLRG